MSSYIHLGKIPGSPEERKELIARRVGMEEYLAGLELTFVQRKVAEFLLTQKGYPEEDIEVNKNFKVSVTDTSFDVTADIVLKAEGIRFLVIKCVMNSMESWERHSTAFCRVVEPCCQIPFAVITDGEGVRTIDVLNGGVSTGGLDSIPSRQDAGRLVRETVMSPYAVEKCEKEKRILYAFEAIKCPVDLSGKKEI